MSKSMAHDGGGDYGFSVDLLHAAEIMQDGLAITDRNGCFTYMNPSHLRIFDYSQMDEVRGRSWTMLYEPKIAEWFEQFVFPRLAANGAWRGEAVGVSRLGRPVAQEVALTLIETGGIVCQTRDISARKENELDIDRLRTFLAAAERHAARQQSVDVIFHDITNILAAADTRASLARRLAGADEKVIVHLAAIESALGEAIRVVEGFARTVDDTSVRVPLDLVDLVRKAIELIEVSPHDRRRVIFMTELEFAPFAHDPSMLLLAIANIVKNAIEAGGDRPIEVQVSKGFPSSTWTAPAFRQRLGGVDLGGVQLYISVRDHGKGIDSAIMGRIFNSFYTTKIGVGFSSRGLGLDSVSRLTNVDGFGVTVESVVGEGTLFVLHVPRSTRREPIREMAALGSSVGRRVAVIDDSLFWRNRVTAALKAAGYESCAFSDGESFLDVLDDGGQFDFVIMDYDLSMGRGDNGATLSVKIAAISDSIRIISFSASWSGPSPLCVAAVSKSEGMGTLLTALARLVG